MLAPERCYKRVLTNVTSAIEEARPVERRLELTRDAMAVLMSGSCLTPAGDSIVKALTREVDTYLLVRPLSSANCVCVATW